MLTEWRIGMDEIDYMFAYQNAVTQAEKIDDPEIRKCTMMMLQLINSLNERLLEVQGAEEIEDDE